MQDDVNSENAVMDLISSFHKGFMRPIQTFIFLSVHLNDSEWRTSSSFYSWTGLHWLHYVFLFTKHNLHV